MPISKEQMRILLAKLRSTGLKPPSLNTEETTLMVEVWTEKLARYDPGAVSFAFERWIREHVAWPLPAQMLPIVDAEQAKIERRRALTGPQVAVDELNRALNQALGEVGTGVLQRLHELRETNPDQRRRIINRLAEWAHSFPIREPHQASTFLQKLMGEIPEHLPALSKADEIRETCKLVEAMRGEPEKYFAAELLVDIGHGLIARHIQEGRAPPDVVGMYGHLADRYPRRAQPARQLAEVA